MGDNVKDVFEKIKAERAEKERLKAEAHQAALDYDPFANKGTFNGIGVDRGIGSLPQNKDYKPRLVDTNIPKKIEVRDVVEVAKFVFEAGTVVEGKYGMNIADIRGVKYKSALGVVRSWGISTKDIPEHLLNVQADYFLSSMRQRFLERYETMLSCVASVREYADFKGVPYGNIGNAVFNGRGKNMDIVVIGGTKFILIPNIEFYDWHEFLARKGAKEMSDHGKKREAIYLAAVAGDSKLAEYDSVLEFLSLYEGGIKPAGGRGISGKRGNFYDALRGRITMERFYELYDRWAKDVLKILPVPSRDFGKKVRKLGYRGYNSGGKRGVYFYRVDEEIVGSRVRQLKIPRRGSYPKAVKGWNEFEKMGGEIKK
jgi:hypothetical protein